MEKNNSPNNVINFIDKTGGKNAVLNKKNITPDSNQTRIIAITSGKGGVGKTNIVANLGHTLSLLGERVLVLDADLGLGNMDVLLGMAPKYNMSHVILGEKNITEILIKGPGGMKILPASSGIYELTQLTDDQRKRIFTELDNLLNNIDILLIDTAAGISSNVMYFNVFAQEIIVVASPEPTSITDAYALMKVLSLKYFEKKFRLIVNLAESVKEADYVFKQLNLVAGRFLDITINYLGYVLKDKKVVQSVKHQQIVTEMFPDTLASECFFSLAQKICRLPPPDLSKKKSDNFWKNFFQNKL